MPEITVTIDACEPTELMRHPTEYGVWIRLLPVSQHSGWEEVQIRGEPVQVWNYIRYHWDKDVADQFVPEFESMPWGALA